jgi:uncharacterized RDD family membrane protein YckC
MIPDVGSQPIESYTETEPEIAGAGFWIRLLARVIDLILHYGIAFTTGLFVGVIAVIVAAVMGIPYDTVPERFQTQTCLDYIMALLGSAAYHTLCEGVHGSTLGKLICGLVVIKEDKKPCGLLAALERSLALYVDGLLLGLPAILSMRESPRRQRLGDRWAKTMVVKTRDLESTMEPRSGLRFIAAFVCGVTVDAAFVTIGLIF